MVRVLIVDDHAVVRTGLRLLLDAEEDIEVVGEAGTARDAIFEARSLEARRGPAWTSSCPGGSGIEATPQLLHEAAGGEGADPLDAGRSELRAPGVRRGRGGLRPQGGGRRGARRCRARGCRRRPVRQSRRSVRASSRQTRKSAHAPRRIHSLTASARCCGCSRSATRTRRSRRCSSSPCARPRRTARTSCRSSTSRPARTSSRYALANGLLKSSASVRPREDDEHGSAIRSR